MDIEERQDRNQKNKNELFKKEINREKWKVVEMEDQKIRNNILTILVLKNKTRHFPHFCSHTHAH